MVKRDCLTLKAKGGRKTFIYTLQIRTYYMKIKNKRGGFTLIEILVVIGIIAILAAVVLIAINPARQFSQANNSQRASNVNAILNGIGQFIADNRGDTPTLPAAGDPAEEIGATLCGELVPDYLPSLPTDPASDSDGAGVAEADCVALAANDVGYEVEVDADGRITVSAPDAELGDTIEVTR